MAKKPLTSQKRDQRSLDAARDGAGVTLRLALLRRLDREPNRPTRPSKRLLRYSTILAVGVIATNYETMSTHLQAIIGR